MKISVSGVNKILGTLISCKNGPAVCIPSKNVLNAEFNLRDDASVRGCLLKTGECKKFSLPVNSKIKKEDKWFNAVKGVYLVLSKTNDNLPAFDISLDGSLLDCEGHVVASAITYATICAMNNYLKLNLSKDEMLHLVDSALRAISEEANLSEVITMLNSDTEGLVIYNGVTKKYEIADNPFVGSDYAMIIVDGHVPVSSLREEVRSLEKELRKVCDKYAEKYCCPVIDFASSDFKDNLLSFNSDEKRIFKFLYEEHRAAYNIQSLIHQQDIFALGRILDRVRSAFEDNLDMICPEIEWIVKRAYETSGCVGSCIFFEGFCAKAIVILRKSSVEAFKSRTSDYPHIFGFDIDYEIVGSNH